MFKKILIANRGEISVRISRTARAMGISTLAVYAEDDQHSLHIPAASQAVSLGEGKLSDTYLHIDKLLDIAERYACDAIHPGYGFLSENPAFVKACEERGLVFIGPTSHTISLMGNKIAARKFAKEAGVPITEGLSGDQPSLIQKAKSLPFPLLIKAAAGGGGKGMRIVEQAAELEKAITATSREAATYFGDDAVYVEQYLESPRHIEVQVLGDQHGNMVHLFERECSLQRRYQKIIEEAPSPSLSKEVRKKICDAAVKLAKAIPYTNAGTIEFLMDQNQKFYFLEMNTRIQVEHPVSEMTTGIDLVEQQIRVAAGHSLNFSQEDIIQQGHAIECRVYAESPDNNFLPSPGDINYFHAPSGPNYRLDTYLDGPITIQSNYDPMIAKLICYGKDREQARMFSIEALRHFAIHGIDTNISYLSALLKDKNFVKNTISTKYCDANSDQLLRHMQANKADYDKLPVIAAGLAFSLKAIEQDLTQEQSIWQEVGYWRMLPLIHAELEGEQHEFELWQMTPTCYELLYLGEKVKLCVKSHEAGKIIYQLNDKDYTAYVSAREDHRLLISLDSLEFHFRRFDRLPESELVAEQGEQGDADQLKSPMPGKVIALNVKEGETVKKGDVLLVVEAMKMENNILASRDASVEKLFVGLDSKVEKNMPLVQLS